MIEAILAGVVTGLVAYGGIRAELRWLRADVERLERRVEHLERAA